MQALDTYISDIQQLMRRAESREHAYRPALRDLLQSLNDDFIAINDPERIDKVGAPDFVIKSRRNDLNLAYTEAKDIGVSLDRIEKTDQIGRYLGALPNFILTDYVEFRWYLKGQLQRIARLGTLEKDGRAHRLIVDEHGVTEVRQLLAGFATEQIPAVHSAEELATTMAGMTREIARIVEEGYEESSYLQEVKTAFEQTLIPNLNPRQFADMYAQTLAYGLFAARFEYDGPVEKFTLHNAFWKVPESNPFLHEFFQQIARKIENEAIEYQVNALVGLLANADTNRILDGFGKRTRQEDPIVHFYETFLAKYDPKQRERRGVYYTPEPVVSYIVRSVDHILKDTFDLSDGLADRSVTVLDPATGTGTFLYFVIQHIYERVVEKQGQGGTWPRYVQDHLLPRIFGFELLVAPYAVAHMKLGIQLRDMLQKTGHSGKLQDRLGVYLTNTLEELQTNGQMRLPMMEAIAHEGKEASDIKRNKPIMVVLGNPPYSVNSANSGEWITNLIQQDYYPDDDMPEQNPKVLLDDYVKFIRFAQWRIEKTGFGVLAVVTNHGYLDNPTFRKMRLSLMKSFDEIYLIDLHGNARKREISPDGSPDENVFDIRQGVAIGIFVKSSNNDGQLAKIHHSELWGRRSDKYTSLFNHSVQTEINSQITPEAPFYLFVPHERDTYTEYQAATKITSLFPVNSSGMNTLHDAFTIYFDRDDLNQMLSDITDEQKSTKEFREKYKVKDSRDWKLEDNRQKALQKGLEALKEDIQRCLYRPFDERWMVLNDEFVGYARWETTNHFLPDDGFGFITSRQSLTTISCLVSDIPLAQHKIVDPYHRSYIFPLYIYPQTHDSSGIPTLFDLDDSGEWPLSDKGRRPNLSRAFVDEFAEKLGLTFITDGTGDLETTFGPEDILHYAYAIFHSPTYRERYAEFLKIDFPRLPLTSDVELFRVLAGLGAELVALHLMTHPALDDFITTFPEAGDNEIPSRGGYPKYDAKTQRVNINKEQYFEGVPPEVWEFYVGGYQVLEKWLKDRRGRELSFEDIMHYQRIVVALKETIRLMEKIDAAIPGWPVA